MAAQDAFADSPAGGESSWAIFGSHDMIEALGLLRELRSQAVWPEQKAALSRLEGELQGDLRALAMETAQIADEAIRTRLRQTAHRPPSNRSIHLEDLIHSQAMPFGSVRVALISELDKAVNDQGGYGPYWRAQEEGSVAVGNEMVGRIIFGRFFGPAGDDVPRSEFGGAQKVTGEGSTFLMGADPGGYGTVHHEIEGRHFLRDGAEQAAAFYARGIATLSQRYVERIMSVAGFGA